MARFLAIDWDQNHLHVVAAEVRSGAIKIERAASWQESTPNPANAEEMGRLLRDRLKEAGIAPAPVLVGIARDRVIVKDIRHPPVPEADEPALVRFQAVKELTEAADEVIIDYMPVGDRRAPGERRANVVIVRREIVNLWKKLCLAGGLRLEGMTPRPLGAALCLRKIIGTTALTPPPSPPDSAVACVVIGQHWAEFLVTRGDALLLARPVAAGPTLAGEIRRNLAVFNGQAGQEPAAALYLTGNVTPELRERLSDMLPDLPLHPFDPFAGMELPDIATTARGAFAGAVGLLHAKAQKGGLPINFVRPRQPKPPARSGRQLVLAGFLLVVLLFGGIAFGSVALLTSKNVEKKLIDADIDEAKAKVLRQQEENKRLKAIDDWDSAQVVALDEFYDLAHRITDVNTIRIQQVTLEPAPQTAKSRGSAKIILKGSLQDLRRTGRAPLDEMLKTFAEDGWYSPEAPKVEGSNFTVYINVERRPSGQYSRALKGL